MSGPRFAMISSCMIHGDMTDFANAQPDVDRLRLVGLLSKI